MSSLPKFMDALGMQGVELIPYHTYGGSKSEQLGYADNGRKEWVPDQEDLLEAKRYLENLGARLI